MKMKPEAQNPDEHQNSLFQMFFSSHQGVTSFCPNHMLQGLIQHGHKSTLWQIFRLPTVHAAEVSTATEKINQATNRQNNQKVPTATDKMDQAPNLLEDKKVTFISEMEVQNYLSKETGSDRLRMMFSKDHIGNRSPEVQLIANITLQTAALTFLVTSMLSGRHARYDFIEKHKATVFPTKFRAFRSLQDDIFLRSMKEGGKWALKASVFALGLIGISQTIAVYRNKSSPWEYAAAGGIASGLFKVNLGPKGMLAGAVFGSVGGLLAGVVMWSAMCWTEETQEQRHYWQIQKLLENEKAAKGLLVTETGEQLQPQLVG